MLTRTFNLDLRARDLNEAASIQCQQSLLKKLRLCRADKKKRG